MEVVLVVVLIGTIVAWVIFKRGETLRFETTAKPAQILMQANSELGTKKRWAVVGQAEQNVVFAYHKKPRFLVAFILFWFFIIPGILYLVLAGKRESLNVMFYANDSGSTVVQVTSNGYRGKMAGRSLKSVLEESQPATHPVAPLYGSDPQALTSMPAPGVQSQPQAQAGGQFPS